MHRLLLEDTIARELTHSEVDKEDWGELDAARHTELAAVKWETVDTKPTSDSLAQRYS